MTTRHLLTCLSAGVLAAAPAASVGEGVNYPYVLGFTFQGEYSFDNLMPEEQLRVFNEGAFDGWGLIYVWNYAAKPGTPPEKLADALAWLKKRLRPGKHIWPAVSLSRIIQPAPGYLSGSTRFHKIPGMDLDDEAGARAIFEREWRDACLIAQELGSPGIFFDPEWYGNGAVRYPGELARMRNEDVATTLAKCRAFGARLADITEKAYPGCQIFTMYTGLYERPENWTTVAHIHLGIIQRTKKLGSRQMLIDGGELGVGYLATSSAALQERIFNRWIETRDLLGEYPNYELGGVLAPYVDRNERSYWAAEHRIGPERTAKDFVPHFRELFRNYRFTWLYGTAAKGKTGFNPWEAGHSAVMGAALERARRTSYYAPPELDKLPEKKVPEGDRGWTAERLTHLPKRVLVDWANPGRAKIIRKYYRGQGGVPEAATIAAGPYSADGRQWQSKIEFDKSGLDKGQQKWPGPGVSAANLQLSDVGDHVAVWTEVYNAGAKPIEVRLAVFPSGDAVLIANGYAGYATGHNIAPGESRVLFCEDVKGPVEAVALGAAYQPEERMSVYVSPVYLAKNINRP